MWRVIANILNKQSRTADKGCLPVWGVGRESATLRLNEMLHRTADVAGSRENSGSGRGEEFLDQLSYY
jgi:hypothetical protein